ncbi:hypothetical protein [Neptunitalea lumnitzerae]|nr:hypothetical protein [Neptunitalea sp. Y10]
MIFSDFGVLREYNSLIVHYKQHKACFNDSFYDFVDKHYGNKQDTHSKMHHANGHKIPFSGHSLEIHHFVGSNIPTISFRNYLTVDVKKELNTHVVNCPEWLFGTYILQPPKC